MYEKLQLLYWEDLNLKDQLSIGRDGKILSRKTISTKAHDLQGTLHLKFI